MPSLVKKARGSRFETCEMPSAAETAGTGHRQHRRCRARMVSPSNGKLDVASALAPRLWRDARRWRGGPRLAYAWGADWGGEPFEVLAEGRDQRRCRRRRAPPGALPKPEQQH